MKENQLPKKKQPGGGKRKRKKRPITPTKKGVSKQSSFVPKDTTNPSESLRKPRLEAMLFCDYATQTIDGKYILGGIFERFVFTHEEEKVTHYFYLFLRLGQTTDGQIQVAFYDPIGKIISAVAFEVSPAQFVGNYPPQINFLDKVRFSTPVEGVYWFDISYQGESLGGAPLIVDFMKPEAEKDEHESKHAKE